MPRSIHPLPVAIPVLGDGVSFPVPNPTHTTGTLQLLGPSPPVPRAAQGACRGWGRPSSDVAKDLHLPCVPMNGPRQTT